MTPALSIIEVSIGFSVAMTAAFAVLLVRRWLGERKAPLQREAEVSITRSYLRRVAGQADNEPRQGWTDQIRLAAVSHIHLLLRGGERDRLMQMAELDGLLDATLRGSRRWRTARRIDAIRMLQQFGSEACIARLREMMARDSSPNVRNEAAFALAATGALPPPRETIRILGMFERKPNRLDLALLRASAPHYPEQLQLLLEDEISSHWRAQLVDAIGWCEGPEVLPLLEHAARSDCAEVRCAAIRAAGRFGHPRAHRWILEALDDPAAIVRIQAANCCATLHIKAAVWRLKRLLDDDELWVRLRARHALDVLVDDWPSDETVVA